MMTRRGRFQQLRALRSHLLNMSSYNFLIFSLLYAVVHIHAVKYTPVVSTTSGPVRGLSISLLTGQSIRRYLGIPFAKAERFQPPQAPTPWSSTKDAFGFGKACPQSPSKFYQITDTDMSEDCLNLNIFSPNYTDSDSALPVMVWIYGGAYTSGLNRIYDGSYLAALGDVIVVVVNYRIGALGYLATGKDGDLKGNYGMLDQVEALKWVKNNIKGFGGNPGKVTIFGESAGGSSVGLLMLSPLASGLFHNAIPQSGSAAASWASTSYEHAQKLARSFGKIIGCEEIGTMVKCLEGKNFAEIVAAGNKIPYSGGPGLSPVIDGRFLPDSPLSLLKEGKFDKVNVMIGVTNDDGSVIIPEKGLPFNISDGFPRLAFVGSIKTYNFGLTNQPPATKAAIIYRYTDWANVKDPKRNRRMYIDLGTDSMFAAPAVLSASAFLKKKCSTYFYQLEYRAALYFTGMPVPSWTRAYHGSDVMFVFGALLRNVNNSFSLDANFTRGVIKLWTNFAKTGNPNKPGNDYYTWPSYDLQSQKYLALKPAPSVGMKLRADYMGFWNDYLPQTVAPQPTSPPAVTCKPVKSRGVYTRPDILVLVGLVLVVFRILGDETSQH